MYERFTDAVRQCMVKANREAKRYGHNYIGSLHIFIAVLETNPPVLDAPGINIAQLHETAVEVVQEIQCAGAKQAIENALNQAVVRGSKVVDIPHLVLGILMSPDRSMEQVFDRTSMDLAAVRIQMLENLADD